MGGTANDYRELQALRHLTEQQLTVPRALATGRTYLSPLIAAVFALVLYGLFLSGILRGDVFPDFECSASGFTTYEEFANCNPSTKADMAPAMLWGFIAGFAESLVPNILDRMVTETAGTTDANSADEKAP